MTAPSPTETLEQTIARLAQDIHIEVSPFVPVGDKEILFLRAKLRSVARLTLERAAKVCRNEARSCGAMMKSCHFQDACAIEKLAEEELKV